MSKQHIGSHSNHAHPDGQMRPRAHPRLSSKFVAGYEGPTSTQRQVAQRVASKKRRQRDRLIDTD